MTQDVIYTVPNECGCCQEQGCKYGGGCGVCITSSGEQSSIPQGYICYGCSVMLSTHQCGWGQDLYGPIQSPSSGAYIKCDPNNPGSLQSIPCVSNQYSNILVTTPEFSLGTGACSFGGAYILTNYGYDISSVGNDPSSRCATNGFYTINGVQFPIPALEQGNGCRWEYGGSDVQEGVDPATRCTTYSSCSECAATGPTFSYPFYRGYSSFGVVFVTQNPSLGNVMTVSLSAGNFITNGGCFSVGATYVLASGNFMCSGPNSFNIANGQSFGFPVSVTVEVV